jgi:hypothetical protein
MDAFRKAILKIFEDYFLNIKYKTRKQKKET